MIGIGNDKQFFMLTAITINNSFLDFQRLTELFIQRRDTIFKGDNLDFLIDFHQKLQIIH